MASAPVFRDTLVKATHRYPNNQGELEAAISERPGEVWFHNGSSWTPNIARTDDALVYYAVPIDFEYDSTPTVGDGVIVHGGEHAVVVVDEPDALGSIVVQMDQTDFYQLIHQSNVRKVN